MPDAETNIAFDGPSVEDGTMDVRDLAPALLALGDVCQEANRILNGDRAKLSVRVHADVPRGSFVVHLALVQSIVEQAKTALFVTAAIAPADILKFLGLKSFDLPGVLQAIKRLKGKKPTATVSVQGGNIQLNIAGDNNVVVISPETAKLLENPRVRDGIDRALKPLESEGIDRFEVREQRRVVDRVERQEKPYFAAIAHPEMEEAQGIEVASESEALVHIVRPAFRDDVDWTVSDGTAQYNAVMNDEEFKAKVFADAVSFRAHDALRVRMRVTTKRGPTGRLSTQRTILKVLEELPGPQPEQLTLVPKS